MSATRKVIKAINYALFSGQAKKWATIYTKQTKCKTLPVAVVAADPNGELVVSDLILKRYYGEWVSASGELTGTLNELYPIKTRKKKAESVDKSATERKRRSDTKAVDMVLTHDALLKHFEKQRLNKLGITSISQLSAVPAEQMKRLDEILTFEWPRSPAMDFNEETPPQKVLDLLAVPDRGMVVRTLMRLRELQYQVRGDSHPERELRSRMQRELNDRVWLYTNSHNVEGKPDEQLLARYLVEFFLAVQADPETSTQKSERDYQMCKDAGFSKWDFRTKWEIRDAPTLPENRRKVAA